MTNPNYTASLSYEKGVEIIHDALDIPTFEKASKNTGDKSLTGYQQRKKHTSVVCETVQSVTSKNDEKLKSEVKKNKSKVLRQIEVLGGNLSQGFNLISRKKLANATNYYNYHAPNGSKKNKEALTGMLAVLSNDLKLTKYLDESIQNEIDNNGLMQNNKINWKGLSLQGRSQLSNVKLKARQLFILYKKFMEAQIELLTLAEDIAQKFNGRVCSPPGAFQGTKSFSGALQKVTIRERSSNVGELKDCARATILFNTSEEMILAKQEIANYAAFQAIRHHQKALKDRYNTGTSELKKFNSGATKAGYRDIKFFLRMPESDAVAELQLNTTAMDNAKSQAHIIYEILRLSDPTKDTYIINNPDVLKGLDHGLTFEWLKKIQSQTPVAKQDINTIKRLISSFIANGKKLLIVDKAAVKSLSTISKQIYEIGYLRSGTFVKKSKV
ncbi:hypothetical protein M9194_04755 [Vibrio sp. S4M6]|uniref:hypothetical protein n=1 Tax=Vibrio sinus TaxID=2946865 RepID=UPI002029F78D|nr:hypothetical protein [Vibrio sinus]MCL9780747.1 hypothetical protein [Vibrio sinus]